VSAVWFTWDGTLLRFAFNKKRQKYRNVLREPRVAIAIADPANPYRALEIRGSVARIEDDLDFRFINAASQNAAQEAPSLPGGEDCAAADRQV
jgi:hypothetical protein